MDLTVGIPRGLSYYRNKRLWLDFFKELGIKTVVSDKTTKAIMEEGLRLSVDEMCLSGKIYIGHVATLIGKCDYILVPRVSNYGFKRMLCTRFEAMPDIIRNTFWEKNVRLLSYNLDMIEKQDEKNAFLDIGNQLNIPKNKVLKAYKKALKAQNKEFNKLIDKVDSIYKSDGLKILICAHDYVIKDPYLGRPVVDGLKKLGAIPIPAHIINSKAAVKAALSISPTLKWQYNLEILGALGLHKDDIDGVILLSAFPCGPDSMVNEVIMRRIKDVPMINITLDGQSGSAGLETRLESFIDIIRFKEEGVL